MGRFIKTTSFKKFISLLTVICMLMAFIPATVTFADSADVITVANTLDDLPDETKAVILEKMWQYAILEPLDGTPVDAAEIADEVIEVLNSQTDAEGNPIDVIGDGAGKISRDALIILSTKLLEYSSVFKSYYSSVKQYMTNDAVKTMLGLSADATEYEVFQNLMDRAFPIVKVNSDGTGFVKVDNFNTVALSELDKLQASDDVKALGAVVISLYTDKFIADANSAITTYGFNVSEVAAILRAYNLCEAATATPTPTTTPKHSSGGGGGGGAVSTTEPSSTPAASSTPSASSTPAPSSTPSITDETKLLDDTLNAISTLDTAAAAAKATEAISQLSDIKLNTLTLEQVITLENKVSELVDAVMNKASEKAVTATVEGSTATVNLSASDVASITNTIKDIVAAADQLSSVVKDSKLDVTVEKELKLNATTGSDVKEANFAIPAEIMNTAKDSSIDKITLNTDVATFSLSPKALGDVKDTVTLSAAKVDKDAIPAQSKELVGDNVIVSLSVKVGDKSVTNFSKPITVSIPYTLKPGEDQNKITVFYVKDDGTIQNVAGVYDAATNSVVFTTKHFSFYMVKAVDVKFSDVSTSDWYKETVEGMAAKGVIKGYDDGSFKPQSKITRAEFAALLVRGFDLSDATAQNTFSDVKADDWFANDVAAAAKSGIVSGVGNGAFAPREYITRQDMAVMISRVLKIVKNKSGAVVSSQNIFSDSASIAAYAKEDVAAAAKYQIIKGLPSGEFAPNSDATRAEAATMISRLFYLD